jgi:hypothetical protein
MRTPGKPSLPRMLDLRVAVVVGSESTLRPTPDGVWVGAHERIYVARCTPKSAMTATTARCGLPMRFTSRLVPRLLHALGPRGVLYLTWDEGSRGDRRGPDGPGGGRVALIAAGGAARSRATTAVVANHYALLRTLEAGFGLRALGNAGKASTPLLRRALGPR